ncbi:MAG: preprotein translocase subunit YajC [Gammaproteobacteria bacterium]
MGFFIDNAWAQDALGAGDGGLMGLLPLVLIFVVFYFLLIRPQTKRQKEHKEMVSALSVGDEIVTAGGVLGKVTQLTDQFVKLEVSNGVELTVQRHTVGAVMPKGTIKAA